MGKFAIEKLILYDTMQLKIFEEFLAEDDIILFQWLSKAQPLPSCYNKTIINDLLDYINNYV